MPPYCTYCHDATGTHNARDCPKTRHHKRAKVVLVKAQPKCWECDSTEHLRYACLLKKPRRTPTSPKFSDYITPDVEPTSRDSMDITEPVVLDSDDEDMNMNAIPERKDSLSIIQLDARLFDVLDNTYQSTSTPMETVASGDCTNSSPNNDASSMEGQSSCTPRTPSLRPRNTSTSDIFTTSAETGIITSEANSCKKMKIMLTKNPDGTYRSTKLTAITGLKKL